MSDIGEMWAAQREASQAKRASNREQSARLLASTGIPFVSRNGGAHLIVGEPPFADFWPGTGKFIERGSNRSGRGVKNLLRALRAASARGAKGGAE